MSGTLYHILPGQPTMDMILLDWTRMGKTYCLAGVVEQGGRYYVVRPLPLMKHSPAVRNVGWLGWCLDGHARWEIFELVGLQPAPPQPPHLEDMWVRALRPRRQLAAPTQRRAILEATSARPGEALFGTPLQATQASAFVPSGTGMRSLATLLVNSQDIGFHAWQRQGSAEPEYRVRLQLPGLGERFLPVKDHHLLCRVEDADFQLADRIGVLNRTIQHMGTPIALRLGLSRAFPSGGAGATPACWLMADGFFSFTEPQS
jgi:hypothetical protein